jgi:thiol:disulfide interchange protein/DsbC/DsbD-like thiol-disulfide interchange protein
MNLRRFLVLLSLASFGSALVAEATLSRPVRNGAVTVQLVAGEASVQPGRPFRVALKMDHEPHWHSYWINAGTGYPTSIAWTLPEGFKAGPILWPAPHTVKDKSGKVTGNGYEGTVYLFTEITPPANLAPGATVTLKAATEWLMCEDACMPGEAALTLALPVAADAPAASAAAGEAYRAALADLPRAPEGWTLRAAKNGKSIRLHITPGAGTTHAPRDLHYFDENAVVDYEQPQTVRPESGGWVMELVASEDGAATGTGLKGVLTSASGWRTGAGYGGMLVDTAFASAAASAPVSGGPGGAVAGGGGGAGAAVGAAGGAAVAGGSGIGATLLLAFLGGLVLNLMPCVFPVLGIKILGFVNQSGSDKRKVVLHGLVFAGGVLASFWALAGLLLVLRAGGEQLGWGFQLQSPAFVFGMAVFMLVFALNLSGLFEVGLSATGAGANLQAKEGYAGSFFTGMLATLVATPCSAPFLAPALGAALALSPVESILVFTAIAVGLAAPYLLLSMFPQAVRLLPRPGAWMETFKQLMAFPLYATVGWLLWVLAAQTAGDDNALLMIAFAFVLIAMAAWAYGRFGQAYGKPARQVFGRILAAGLLVGGLWLGWPRDLQAANAAAKPGEFQVVWEKWSPDAVTAARAAGRHVYVDFTARWCATCQTNKAAVFSSKDLLAEFGRRNVLLLKADWTNKDPQITQELAKWKRSAVPFNLLYGPAAKEPVVLPELLTGGTVLEALAGLTKGS